MNYKTIIAQAKSNLGQQLEAAIQKEARKLTANPQEEVLKINIEVTIDTLNNPHGDVSFSVNSRFE